MSGGTFTPLQDVFEALGTEELAERWFESVRWGDGALCPRCSSDRCEKTRVHPTQPWYCSGCRKYFSVKVNSFMHASKLGYVKWALAIYLVVSSPKGISSTNLAKQLGITQKAAWHMGHRIREAWVQPTEHSMAWLRWTKPTSAASSATCPSGSAGSTGVAPTAKQP